MSVGVLLFLGAAALWTIGTALVRPAPAHIGDPPADLAAESVRIARADGAPMAGWLARGDAGRGAVLLLHPLRGSRATMLSRARLLHRAGYTVLLVDLPAHGESAGDRITFGADESAGARAALAFLRRVAPDGPVGALGASLGGASLLVGSGEPVANGADAVVLEAVYPAIDDAVADRLRIRVGALGPLFAPLLTWQLRPRIGIAADELRPLDRMRRLRVPVLVIAGEADRHTTLAESERLFAAAPQPKEFWVVPGAAHGDLHAAAPAAYEQHVLAFFARHLRRGGVRDDRSRG